MKLSICSYAFLISCLSFFLTSSTAFSSDGNALPGDFSRITAEIENRALDMAQPMNDLLVEIAKVHYPPLVLREDQVDLAFDVFFGHSLQFLLTRLLSGNSPRPQLIWVKAKRREGNSTLLKLISKVLDPGQFDVSLHHAGNYPASFSSREMDAPIVILDDFSHKFREFSLSNPQFGAKFAKYLETQIKRQSIIVLDDERTLMQIDPSLRQRIAFIADGGAVARMQCRRILQKRH